VAQKNVCASPWLDNFIAEWHDVHVSVTADERQSSDIELSPLWVPDSSAAVCMVCLKSRFTVVNRRVRILAEIFIPIDVKLK